jgi:FkbM family methyltransferase
MIKGLAKYLSSRGVDFSTFATVFDIGSRDGRQSLQLAKLFPNAIIVSVECNPQTLDQCRSSAAKQPRIRLVEKAINSYTGRCRFFPIDTKRTITSWTDGNPGASSLFVATGDYPTETYVQNEIEVECIRLDDLCNQLAIKAIDLIWMDLQGAELLALQSAGTFLDSVRYIYTEVSHRAIYAGQCLFDDVETFLTSRGFARCTQIDRERWQQDAIYVNQRNGAGMAVSERPNAPQATAISGGEGGMAGGETAALRFLLACARVHPSQEAEADIRKMLEEGIDWNIFARKATDHELAGLCGRTLSRIAPDLVPGEILDALGAVIDETRRGNQKLFDELGFLLDLLASQGIDAIPLKGPVLAIQAFGDLGLRRFRDLDFLLRDRDLRPAIAVLRSAGYYRQGAFTDAQFETIHRLQGQEIIFKQSIGTAVEPHTRLTAITMALDIDYEGIWRRAKTSTVLGRSILTLAPEDCLCVLAIHGGKELWWNIKWVCDVAAFIEAHPQLDWAAVEKRARAQGCLRMVLLAASLAHRYLGAVIPDEIAALVAADRAVQPTIERIAAHWRAEEVTGPPSNKILSLDRLRLHDGLLRRIGYIVRTWFLPKPHHIGLAALPAGLGFAYVPIKLFHDIIALPLYRAYEWLGFKNRRSQGKTAGADAAPQPADADAWARRAQKLLDANRVAEAMEANSHALAIDPDNIAAVRVDLCSKMRLCDWRQREEEKRRITESLREGRRLIAPVFHRAIFDSEAEHFLLTQLWTKGFSRRQPLWRGELYRHDKVRVAYLSTDFRDHVVADVIAGCLEHHDKTRFEITGVSLGPDDGSTMRRRIEIAFDRFVDVQKMRDVEVAAMLRELEIDIAIDLNGYSGEKRTGILACRPAPVQVNYLGFPGTMNAPFMDYIIADKLIIPAEHQIHYSEKVAYLPHTYFPTDRTRPIAEITPSRAEAGLPESGFVFACHNAPHKITPELFDVWMRLLHAVEGSVLWLKSMPPQVVANLGREAQVRGIVPGRLVFAPRVPKGSDHLARLRLADVFLDTQPYNAHATASDALWAGLPVITCAGGSFPSRVAASLLHAAGLPELVTTSLAEYEELARTLAQDPQKLALLKAKLLRNRDTEPLFDTAGFARHLEAAYAAMWKRQQAGLPPATFAVPG